MATCGASQTGSVQSCLNRLLLIFFGFFCTDQKMTIFMCIEIMYNSKCGFEAKFTIKLFYFLFFFQMFRSGAHCSPIWNESVVLHLLPTLYVPSLPRSASFPSSANKPPPQTSSPLSCVNTRFRLQITRRRKKKKQKIKHLNLESATHKEAGWEQMRPFLRELMYILTGFEGSVAGIHRVVFPR